MEARRAVKRLIKVSLIEKICRGIGLKKITAENRDVAIFFSVLPPLPTLAAYQDLFGN